MTKGKTRKEKKRLLFISAFVVALLALLVGSVYSDFIQIIDNKKTTEQLTSQYESLLAEEESLQSEVAKMQDPNYIARYAKEKYMYSSEDEVILRID